MRAALLASIVLLATPALAGRRSRSQAPAPEPPTPPVILSAEFDTPPPGSWVSTTAARRSLGLDGLSRIPGDVITVLIVENTVTQIDASTMTENEGSQDLSIGTMFGLEAPLSLGNGEGDLGVRTSRKSSFDGQGRTGRGSRINSTVSCTITRIVPPVNDYEIWCSKQVSVNKETQWVVLTGRVRARDLSRDNTVRSDRIAHAKIEVAGRGVVADKQRPGLLARVLDRIWPF